MKRQIISSLLLYLALSPAMAQMGKLFDANQQLSSSFTSQVYLDNDGFIWSATRNGLNKYDGYQFRILKKENEQQSGMASNYVNCIKQDRNGLFYMGMWGALQTYNGNKFHDVIVTSLNGQQVNPYVTCFVERRNGEMWAGTSGLGVLKFDDPQHAHQVNGTLKSIHTVEDMIEDQRGSLWIVTRDRGLIHVNGNITHVHCAESPLCTYLTKVCEDNKGNIYLGTTNAGLMKLTGKEFKKVENAGNKPISALYFSPRQGKLFIGYDGGGLAIYDPTTGQIVDNPYYSQEIDLTKAKIYSITEDKSGNIWLGMLQKGLYMQPGRPAGFGYMGYKLGSQNKIGGACVTSTFIDKRGRTWIGTDKDGLYCLDGNRQLLKHYKDNFPASILTITEDLTGRIWIGSYNEGGGWIDPASGQYHPYAFTQNSNPSIFDIEVDKKNQLWVATMGNGLLKVDDKENKVTAYTLKGEAPVNEKLNTITNDYLSQVSISPDGKRIYAATTMGVCCLDIETGSWTSFFGKNCLNYGTAVRIAREYGGKLWIGTNDELYCYDIKSKQLQPSSSEKGLANNGIASIEQDKKGRLWISTDHGLYCYNPKTGLTNNYFIDNGLQSNEFSDGASCTTPSGDMLFGGVGGITWFNPDDIRQAQWDATVELTAFSINGEPISSFTRSARYQVTDTTVIASKHFQLSYHDNSFALQLSTLTYDNPEHITYLYSINGENFVRLRPGVNEITFSHMPPGTYKFKVKAERNNMETPVREFTVVVHSPWYRSTWAYLFYALLLGLGLWQFLGLQKRKQQDRLRLQEHIHAEEMGEAKLRFFMNISHEIRTPMTLILTPLLTLMKEDGDPHRRYIYKTIKRNAERILHLINQMMDLRKIDKGMMQMRMKETDLVEFVRDIHTLFETQAKTKSINLSYEHDSDKLLVWIDRGNFDKIVMNILSNAFKYTPNGGEINIKLTHDEHNASLAISDDGEKIPEELLTKIFERFYQSSSTANDRHTGTGIGLDLTRSLVELHHGTIKAQNLEKGCEFIVTIPLGKEHLKPEEIVDTATAEPEAAETVQENDWTAHNAQIATPLPVRKKQTIVIAEDDNDIRDFLISQLEQDYEIKACNNGRDAFSETLGSLPDLVLSDVMMPEMDGNTLCSKIKSNPSTNHIPVVLLTAKNLDEDKLQGLETGADAYVVKPFNMDILRQTIVNLINSHRLLRLKYARNDELEEKVDDIQMKSPDEKLLERIIKAVNQHLNDSELSVDMIADEVGISRVHLHRKMKELTGQTPHNFIRNIRLKKAANLLGNQGMNITEVMYACGFSNPTSFSTVFKKFYGVSPRDYMKEHSDR